MKRISIFIFMVILLFLTSCIKSRIMKQPGMDFEPTDPSGVEIYYLEPELSYIKIGIVETSGAPLSSWKKAEKYMKIEASKIGGHAVIITEKGRPVGSLSMHGNVSLVHRHKELTGIVIRWKK